MISTNFTKLTHWWSVVALARNMPRTGWNTIGLDRHQMDNLAAHHYMVTSIANLLALVATEDLGITLDRKKVSSMALVHDLGEVLLGADMATPQGVNPKYQEAKQAARRLEDRVIEIFGQLLGPGELQTYMFDLCQEERLQTSDEAKLVKLADRIADHIHLHNVQAHARFNRDDEAYFDFSVLKFITTIKHSELRAFCEQVGLALKSAVVHRELEVGVRPVFDPTQAPERALIQLFNHFQGAKRMLRTGWIPGRFASHEIDTLAEHGYLSSILLMMLGKIWESDLPHTTNQLVDMTIFHEAGKLYGGGMSVLFNVREPKLSNDINIIRQTTVDSLAQLICYPKTQAYFLECYTAATARETDLAKIVLLVSRLADQLHRELVLHPHYNDRDKVHREKAVSALIQTIHNEHLQKDVQGFHDHCIEVIQSGKLNRSVFALLEDDSTN